MLFKAGTIQDGKLHVSTQTEILTYELPGFRQVKHLSLPCFNDYICKFCWEHTWDSGVWVLSFLYLRKRVR